MNLSILGTQYEVICRDYTEDAYFEKNGCDGYCDKTEKRLVICNLKTHPSYQDNTETACAVAQKETIRHEITHAFLHESGLDASSSRIVNMGWAENEEMVDWIALQAPKLIEAFRAADAL